MLACLWSLAGCDNKTGPPRSTSSTASQASRCKTKARFNDPTNVKFLPRTSGSFCLDPSGSDRAYGEGAQQRLDGICDLFDGECEIYKDFKVKRVVEARYVDGAGSPATIDVYLSTYSSRELAYGMFTKRVIGSRDPAHPDTAKPIAGGGAAALGIGNAYLWRGQMLAEIAYADDTMSTQVLKTKAAPILTALVKQLGQQLPGATELPAAAAALPKQHRLPLGIRYVTGDLLGVAGAGPGAIGYYQHGQKRWRELVASRGDADQARDVLRAVARTPGSAPEKGIGAQAVRLMVQPHAGAIRVEWLVARKGPQVRGIGDERTVLRAGMTAEQHHELSLSQADKRSRLEQRFEEAKK